MWTRLRALVVKELLVVLRDPRSRAILIAAPVVQLVVFASAATLEVKNVDVAILDRDEGRSGSEVFRRLEGSPTFRSVVSVDSPAALRKAVDHQKVLVGIQLGSDFSREIAAGRTGSVQVLLDGRRSNASQIVSSYVGQIIETLAAEQRPASRPRTMVRVVPRNWYNPNLTFTWFTVPALVAIIAQMVGLLVTALSVARERELGTFDQLMVAPFRLPEILLGKLLAPFGIGVVHVTMYVLAAVLIFHVPLRGSLLLLYGAAFVFVAAVAGVGLFISSLCSTQQQAILGMFLFFAPATLLSGFATPIENMPGWLQPITTANPLRWFIEITRGVFLRAMPAAEVGRLVVPLGLIALVTLTSATFLFRARTE